MATFGGPFRYYCATEYEMEGGGIHYLIREVDSDRQGHELTKEVVKLFVKDLITSRKVYVPLKYESDIDSQIRVEMASKRIYIGDFAMPGKFRDFVIERMKEKE